MLDLYSVYSEKLSDACIIRYVWRVCRIIHNTELATCSCTDALSLLALDNELASSRQKIRRSA